MDQPTNADTAALRRVWARVQRRDSPLTPTAPPALPPASPVPPPAAPSMPPAWDGDDFLRRQLTEAAKRLALCRGMGGLQPLEALCRRQYRKLAAALYLRTGQGYAPRCPGTCLGTPERCRALYLSLHRCRREAQEAAGRAGELGPLAEGLAKACREGMDLVERVVEGFFL